MGNTPEFQCYVPLAYDVGGDEMTDDRKTDPCRGISMFRCSVSMRLSQRHPI